MTRREQQLMVTRTAKSNRFLAYTPAILGFGTLAAVVITVIFYRRIRSDYQQTLALEQQLVEKDKKIERQINSIDHVAKEIANGNYTIRIDPKNLE